MLIQHPELGRRVRLILVEVFAQYCLHTSTGLSMLTLCKFATKNGDYLALRLLFGPTY